jgi:undecaprenyl diphosphate synthase
VADGATKLEGAEGIDLGRLPRHIAIVMDGNGRWAQRQGRPRTEGHVAGEEALYEVTDAAIDLGVGWVTAYAFSTENWNRPAEEVRFLMQFNEDTLLRRREELNRRNVRIVFTGRRDDRVPERVIHHQDEAAALTAANTGMTLCIAFNYGGRAEIVDAARRLVEDGVPADQVDEAAIAARLYVPDMPDPDLLIRTSGELRLSNILLWEAAYAELLFVDTLWPDFGRRHLFDAIREFQHRTRRFGSL